MPVDRGHAFGGGAVYARPSPLGRALRTRAARPWSSFERRAVLGEGCRFGANAYCVNDGARERVRLGRGVVCRGILRRETFGDGLLEIGDDVYIGDDCIVSCSEHVAVGPATLLGHGVQIFDNNSHPVEAAARVADWQAMRTGASRGEIASAPVVIGARVWIGFGSFVLKGVTIGDEAIVGAGSVVTHDVPAGTVAAGNPARPV